MELGVPLVAYIPYDEAIAEADMLGSAPVDHDPNSAAVKAVAELKEYLKKRYEL